MVSFFPDFLSDEHRENIRDQLRAKLGAEPPALDTDETVKYLDAKDYEAPPSEEEKISGKKKKKKSDDDDLIDIPGEFIFVIDRSGSMDGHRIEVAK